MSEEIVSLWPDPIVLPSALLRKILNDWAWKPYSGRSGAQVEAAKPILDELFSDLRHLVIVLEKLEGEA